MAYWEILPFISAVIFAIIGKHYFRLTASSMQKTIKSDSSQWEPLATRYNTVVIIVYELSDLSSRVDFPLPGFPGSCCSFFHGGHQRESQMNT